MDAHGVTIVYWESERTFAITRRAPLQPPSGVGAAISQSTSATAGRAEDRAVGETESVDPKTRLESRRERRGQLWMSSRTVSNDAEVSCDAQKRGEVDSRIAETRVVPLLYARRDFGHAIVIALQPAAGS